ncbi:MAG TPA: tetratricopeptide repeat protein [Pyrinomonadaceae bacterium]|jgi:hypothetical protein|nr:tetratricopeptide repeat protein [Pyrinomonadaceae bacterium]
MKAISIAILGFFLSLNIAGQAVAGSGVTPEMRTEANKLYQAADWKNAATAYEKIVHLEPKNAGANYRLGMSFLNLNNLAEAEKHLDVAMTVSPNAVFALALAKAYGRDGNKAKAFETLEKSLKLGGISPDTLNADADLAKWKDDAGFKDLLTKSDFAVNPCKSAPEFRQFDFWIGEWDVKNPQGVQAGTSSIQLILGQCIIMENWFSGAGSNGKSFNIYDVDDKKWHQTYVDDKGTFTHYVGGLVGGDMVVTASGSAAGKTTLNRMTFSKLATGDVRQHGETSADDGKTWTTTFDLTYTRKKS